MTVENYLKMNIVELNKDFEMVAMKAQRNLRRKIF